MSSVELERAVLEGVEGVAEVIVCVCACVCVCMCACTCVCVCVCVCVELQREGMCVRVYAYVCVWQ